MLLKAVRSSAAGSRTFTSIAAAPSQPPAASEQPASVQAQFCAAAFPRPKSKPPTRLRGSGVWC